jgi:hypothetical protein
MAEIDITLLFPEIEKINVEIEMLDFTFVENCSDWKVLLKVLQVLQSGKEGHYPELMRKTEEKLLSVMPSREKKRYEAVHCKVSENEKMKAENDLFSWVANQSKLDDSLKMKRKTEKEDGSSVSAVTSSSSNFSSSSSEEEQRFLEGNLSLINKSQYQKIEKARIQYKINELSSLQKTNKAG